MAGSLQSLFLYCHLIRFKIMLENQKQKVNWITTWDWLQMMALCKTFQPFSSSTSRMLSDFGHLLISVCTCCSSVLSSWCPSLISMKLLSMFSLVTNDTLWWLAVLSRERSWKNAFLSPLMPGMAVFRQCTSSCSLLLLCIISNRYYF